MTLLSSAGHFKGSIHLSSAQASAQGRLAGPSAVLGVLAISRHLKTNMGQMLANHGHPFLLPWIEDD
jgi:hypothetical protein